MDVFTLSGLAPPQERDVKLHATLINTKYRDDGDKATEKGKGPTRDRIPINATSILASFGDIDLVSFTAI